MRVRIVSFGLSGGRERGKSGESFADLAKIVGVWPTAGDKDSDSASGDDNSGSDLDDQRAPRAGVSFAERILPPPIVVGFAFDWL